MKAKSRETIEKDLSAQRLRILALGEPGVRNKGTDLKVKLCGSDLGDMLTKQEQTSGESDGEAVLSAHLPRPALGTS